MLRISNVRSKLKGVTEDMILFGCSGAFAREFEERCQAIGRAFAEENSVSLDEARTLSARTPLGTQSSRLFSELDLWLETQCNYAEDSFGQDET